jgi:hypothetical protein
MPTITSYTTKRDFTPVLSFSRQGHGDLTVLRPPVIRAK